MATTESLSELFKKYKQVLLEENLLKDDKKELLSSFNNEISPKVFKLAFDIARKKAKLKPEELDEFIQVMDFLEKQMTIEMIE